jgi:molecular chaperone GrpE
MQDTHHEPVPAGPLQEEPQPAVTEPDAGAAEVMPSIEELLKKAALAAEEHHDAWLRAKAEADNIRKRAQIDIAQAYKYAIENFSSALLAVKDSLASTNITTESLHDGVELTLKQLNSVFEKFNLTEVNPLGQKFDPHRHQAISMVQSDAEPNTVVQVLQKGYLLNDRVIRPAMVLVAKAVEKT